MLFMSGYYNQHNIDCRKTKDLRHKLEILLVGNIYVAKLHINMRKHLKIFLVLKKDFRYAFKQHLTYVDVYVYKCDVSFNKYFVT